MTDNVSISWNLKPNENDTRTSEEKWREVEKINEAWATRSIKLSTRKEKRIKC